MLGPIPVVLNDKPLGNMTLEELEAIEASLAKEVEGTQQVISDKSSEYNSMSIEELEDMANNLVESMATDRNKGQDRYTDLSEYYGDRLQSGITSTPSMVFAAAKTLLYDPFTKGGFTDSFQEGYQRFGENFMLAQHAQQDALGWEVDQTGKKPPNDVHRYLGSGVEAVADPFGLLYKTGLKIANVAGRSVGLHFLGMGSEGGGDIGAGIEKGLYNEEGGTGRLLGSLIGAPVSSTLSKPVTATITKTGSSAFRKYKEIKANPADAQAAYATTYVKGVLSKIVEEKPDIESILRDLNRIGVKWDAGDFPLIAAAGGSPTAHSQLVKLAKTNSTYTQGFKEEFERMAKIIESNADRIFGERYTEFPWSQQQISKGLKSRQQRLIKARSRIDDRIEDLQERLDPKMSEIERGDAIRNLVKTREKLAKAEIGPLYTELLEAARKAGVYLAPEHTGQLYEFVEANAIRDLFGKRTAIDKKVFKKLEPKITMEKGIEIDRTYPSMSFDQIESLKKAINELKRQSLSPTESRNLMMFEKEFNYVREKIVVKGRLVDGKYMPSQPASGFSDRLNQIDSIYFEKVGIPFSSEAIAQIGRKRYTSEVSNIILKNRESLNQYLNVSGAEGIVVARDAMVSKLHEKVVVNGWLDSRKLKRELAKNKNVIDGIPGMADELKKLELNSDYLSMRSATLDDALKVAQKKVSDHFLATTDYAPDYESLMKGMLSNRTSLSKFKKDLKMLDPSTRKAVLNRTRREFIEILKGKPEGAYNYLANPKNAKVIDDIMGNGYSKDMEDFSKVIDAMSKMDISKLSAVVSKAELDPVGKRFGGLSMKYVSSQVRDRISNIVMKMTRIGSKMLDYKTEKSMDRGVFELLIDREGMKKVNAAVAKMDFNIDHPISIKELTGLMKEILPIYMYSSVKTSVSHEAEKIEQKIQ
ncbi:MAG: hypothetical protein ABGY11_01340 [Candidatus Thioglobus sp.]